MANQQKIVPLGRLSWIIVDIVGVKVQTDFEVIQIVEDMDPYPTLLGLDWAIDMGGIINLKKRSMVFENNGTRVIVPLDPAEGKCYTEPVPKEEDVDYIYKLTARDAVNPTEDEELGWREDSECLFDPDEEIENWQNRLHDVSALHFLSVIKDFCCVSLEVMDLP